MSEISADAVKAMTMTQKEMAKLLGVNQSRISQLIKENVIPRDPTTKQPRLFEGLKNYYLSKNATDGEDANFWKERSLHERAKRELAELKLAREKGELYVAAEAEAFLADMLVVARQKLLGLPRKLAPRLTGKTPAQIADMLDAEIIDILTEMATTFEEMEFSAETSSEVPEEEVIE